MAFTDLLNNLITGEWRVQREAARERAAFMAKTREVRSMMLTNQLVRLSLPHDAGRMQFYAAAEPGTRRPFPAPLNTPEDFKQATERIVMIRGARQMEEDYAFFDGILDDFETYVVGDGLVYLPNTGNPEADAVIRDFLETQFDQADYSQRMDLTKMAQLAVRSMKRDGECGFMPVDVGDAVKLHMISGDCIGNPLIASKPGATDWNGIISDPDTGAPVRFVIYRRTAKVNNYVFDREVPADQFWHYYDPFRVIQYHGVTIAKNSLPDYYDLQQILEFSKLNVKWRSSQLPTVHTETGRPRGAGIGWPGYGFGAGQGTGAGPVNAAGIPRPMSIDVGGVSTSYLKLDESVMEYPNDFPNQQLIVLIDELNRRCAKGAKLPVEFCYKSEAGGVLQRFWADKALNTFRKDQHLMRRSWLNPYKNRVIQKGIDNGELDLSRFGDLDISIARFRGRWQMGRAISVDYGRETDADIKKIEAGLMSSSDKVADDGGNIEEVTQENDAFVSRIFGLAKKRAAEFGVPLDAILPFYVKKFPNAPSATQTEVTSLERRDQGADD